MGLSANGPLQAPHRDADQFVLVALAYLILGDQHLHGFMHGRVVDGGDRFRRSFRKSPGGNRDRQTSTHVPARSER